jgi:hypothetical protein
MEQGKATVTCTRVGVSVSRLSVSFSYLHYTSRCFLTSWSCSTRIAKHISRCKTKKELTISRYCASSRATLLRYEEFICMAYVEIKKYAKKRQTWVEGGWEPYTVVIYLQFFPNLRGFHGPTGGRTYLRNSIWSWTEYMRINMKREKRMSIPGAATESTKANGGCCRSRWISWTSKLYLWNKIKFGRKESEGVSKNKEKMMLPQGEKEVSCVRLRRARRSSSTPPPISWRRASTCSRPTLHHPNHPILGLTMQHDRWIHHITLEK